MAKKSQATQSPAKQKAVDPPGPSPLILSCTPIFGPDCREKFALHGKNFSTFGVKGTLITVTIKSCDGGAACPPLVGEVISDTVIAVTHPDEYPVLRHGPSRAIGSGEISTTASNHRCPAECNVQTHTIGM